ncbi:uncharacterized protein LOC114261904 isoform X2 [Camellia sinensis]|uniref:uncharacterized protein LOC114261904 isoform X2 n=1 Tax=Camellia sinensis TaxID=4442 RepID=UPI0010366E95|nr:uncharacterized protein LOC114261904 isoform X2 [Camellia sinensis]
MVEIVCSHPTVDIHSSLPSLSLQLALSLSHSKFKIELSPSSLTLRAHSSSSISLATVTASPLSVTHSPKNLIHSRSATSQMVGLFGGEDFQRHGPISFSMLNSGDLQNDDELWCTADVSSGFCFGVHIRELEEEVKLLNNLLHLNIVLLWQFGS